MYAWPSFGTFGFWTAFLKEEGDVILATGTSKGPTFVESMVRAHLPKWAFLQDPCFIREPDGTVKPIEGCV
jgi:hypothetical protein